MTALALALILAQTSSPAPVDTGVVFSHVAGQELKMDVYRPVLPASGLSPAVVVIHGGAWMGGTREDMKPMCVALSTQGFVAATVTYRLAPQNKWPAMYDDVQTAVRYLRANAAKYQIDPTHIGATGASAGGHLALLLGFSDTRDPAPAEFPAQSSRVAAVLNLFGPTDLRRDYGPALDFVFQAVVGKPKSDAAKEIAEASPVTHITTKSAPVFTIQGTKDPLVPVAQAHWLEQCLKKAGVAGDFRYIEGMGHQVDMKNPKALEALRDGYTFLKTRLSRTVERVSISR